MLDYFRKGLMIGLGIVAVLVIFIPISVYASQFLNMDVQSIGSYELTPNGYEFTWLENSENCADMSARLGVTVKSIQYFNQIIKTNGQNPPTTKKAIRIILDKLPSSSIIDRLDFEAGIKGYQRTGGKSIVDTLQKVDTGVIK
jgi:hypothetical protein